MRETVPIETETWRIILLRRSASELLAFRSTSGLNLPRLEIPIHTRVVPVLNSEIGTTMRSPRKKQNGFTFTI